MYSVDFGLCDTVQKIAEAPKMVGSPAYMPPEMIYHVPQTVQADIYSLGCTLLCALDSRGFELGGRVQTLFSVAKSGRSEFTLTPGINISANMKDFLKRMLSRFPQDRATVDELLAHPILASTHSASPMKTVVQQLITTRNVFK